MIRPALQARTWRRLQRAAAALEDIQEDCLRESELTERLGHHVAIAAGCVRAARRRLATAAAPRQVVVEVL